MQSRPDRADFVVEVSKDTVIPGNRGLSEAVIEASAANHSAPAGTPSRRIRTLLDVIRARESEKAVEGEQGVGGDGRDTAGRNVVDGMKRHTLSTSSGWSVNGPSCSQVNTRPKQRLRSSS